MLIHVDHNSSRPITRQVVEQVQWLIVSGRLKAGDRLPSIRELSKQLQINPTTVTRIYSELAHTGVITLRQGQGAFVADAVKADEPDEQSLGRVSELARTMLVAALRSGMTKRQIDRIVTDEYSNIRSGQHDSVGS